MVLVSVHVCFKSSSGFVIKHLPTLIRNHITRVMFSGVRLRFE